MSTFNSIKDFPQLSNLDDEKNFKRILEVNFQTGKKLADLLREKLDFDFSALGEIFIELPESLSENDKEKLGKYFNIRGNKIGSRGVGYYGLFGDAYKIENRLEKYDKKFWESFWNEYDEYIKNLNKLRSNKELLLIYLDNYRNFLLLWVYILITVKKSFSKQKIKPIQNMAFRYINNEKLDNLLKSLIKTYEILIENIILSSLNKKIDSIFMLPDLQVLYDNIKQIFSDNDIVKTKKGKISLERYFTQNNNTLQIWFEKIFRNIREEDNLGIMLSFFLQKHIDLDSIDNKKAIFKLIEKFRKKEKKEYILSNMYGGIEFAFLAKHLGYDSGLSNFSTYHLGNKNTYEHIDDIFFSLSEEKLEGKEIIILDDNIVSGRTLEKLRTVLENNHITIKNLAVPRICLSLKERKNKMSNVSEIRKHVALNSLYILPRRDKHNRNINALMERKIQKLRQKKGKEFRSL